MQITSSWPLPVNGIRFLVPQRIIEAMSGHPLSRSLYPVAMGYYPDAHGHRMQRQTLKNYLLIYCLSGKGTLTAGNRRYRIGSGDLILLPRGQAHAYSAHSRDPWTIYWLHFDGQLADRFYDHTQLSGPRLNIGVQSRVIRVLDGIADLRHTGNQLSEYIQGCHQLQALLSYIALLSRQQQPRSGKTLNLEQLRALMQEHIHGQLDLTTLAAEANVSKYHFAKKFKELTGSSPIQYFINMKMQRACYLLDSTQQPIKQIASNLGYEDVYYFSRLFKKTIGLSPSQYRQNRQR
ncbi:MAG: AraC family transcriptional regulator [Porticoccaceae bacterium]|nr:AraC family transcriptional regulator [Porticoccaceae bacterium]